MITKGWVWTYYDCSHACYLFGKIELPCFFMSLTSIFVLFVSFLMLFLIYRFIIKLYNERSKKNENN